MKSSWSKGNAEQDPFSNPFLNDIFKPVMALDRLQVLRRDKSDYEILFYKKDLKPLTKEKREEILSMTTTVDEVDDPECDSNQEDPLPPMLPQPKKKRRKKGMLTPASARRREGFNDLSWIVNTAKNNQLIKSRKARLEIRKQQ